MVAFDGSRRLMLFKLDKEGHGGLRRVKAALGWSWRLLGCLMRA